MWLRGYVAKVANVVNVAILKFVSIPCSLDAYYISVPGPCGRFSAIFMKSLCISLHFHRELVNAQLNDDNNNN